MHLIVPAHLLGLKSCDAVDLLDDLSTDMNVIPEGGRKRQGHVMDLPLSIGCCWIAPIKYSETGTIKTLTRLIKHDN